MRCGMSIYHADSKEKKRRDAWFAFLIIGSFAIVFLAMGFALGIEPRMYFERTGKEVFRVTGSNHFLGRQFYSKTIEGVESVSLASGMSSSRSGSLRERDRQTKHAHLEIVGADEARLGWGRTSDSQPIFKFMRSAEPVLDLRDPPPLWRMALSWASLAFGGLIFIAALKSFLPKKPGPTPWS